MKEPNKYSDEYISAYIDGELDSEERTRLLFDEQTDNVLAQRISEARILKEKVQLTYSDVKCKKDEKKTFSCAAFTNPQRALVASLLLISAVVTLLTYNLNNNEQLIIAKQLIKNTQPISADVIADVIGEHERIVINVSQYHSQNFTSTINKIEAILKENNNKSFAMEIVASGQGLKALDTETSIHVQRINQLTDQFNNLKVVACASSLAKLATDGDPVQLMKSIIITPSAAEQVAKRTREGWLYLKI